MQKVRAKFIMLVVAAVFGVGAYASPAVADGTDEAKAACEALKEAAQEGTEEEKEAAERAKEACDAAIVEPPEEEVPEEELPEEEVDQD